MIEMIEDQETIQNHTTMEVKDLKERSIHSTWR